MSEMKFMTLAAQQYYDEKIKAHIAEEDAKLLDKIETHVYSWNDLTDKPFYENIEKETVVISPKTFTPDSNNSFALRCVSEYDEPEYLHDIYVIFDNKLYQCRAVTFTYNGKTVKYSGNLGLAYPQFINETNNIDSHLPFFIEFNTYTVGDKYFNDIYVQDKESEHTIEVFAGNYDMKRIESKYVFGYPSVKEGQTLVVTALNDNGTPCEFEGADVFSGSWNDLTDKPFGETVTIGTKYIEYQEISTENNNVSVSGSFSMGLPTGNNLVIFDGQEYISQTIYKVPPTQNPEIIVGNPSLITEPYNGVPYEDNGLPFAIYYDFRTRETVLLTQNSETAHTIEAYIATYDSKQLDEKYIPDTIARVSDIENIDLTPYETKTDAAAKLEEAKAFASEEDAKVQGAVDTLSGKVTTLIGEDTNKSIRTIANEELAKQLVAEGAKESLDTLAEIAAWIQSHPDDASAMNKAINDLEVLVGALPDGVAATTVIGYVQEVVAANKALIDANTEAIAGLHAVATTGSWNDLEDKPTRLESFEIRGMPPEAAAQATKIYGFVKVSDKAPTLEDFARGGTLYLTSGKQIKFTADEISVGNGGFGGHSATNLLSMASDFVCVVPEDFTFFNRTTMTRGTYFRSENNDEVSFNHLLRISGKEVILEKYIPDTIARVSDIPTDTVTNSELHAVAKSGSWNDLKDKPFYDELNILLAIAEYQELVFDRTYYTNTLAANIKLLDNSMFNSFTAGKYLIIFDGVRYILDSVNAEVSGPPVNFLGNAALAVGEINNGVAYDDNGIPFLVLHAAGGRGWCVYTTDTDATHTIELYLVEGELKQIDEKFIPDSIARSADVENAFNALAPVAYSGSWDNLEDKPTEFINRLVIKGPSSTPANTTPIHGFWYKVSNLTPSIEYFANGCTMEYGWGEVKEFSAEEISIGDGLGSGTGDVIQVTGKSVFYVVPKETVNSDGITLKAGIYFPYVAQYGTIAHTLTIHGKEVILESHIPDTIARISNFSEVTDAEIDAMFA